MRGAAKPPEGHITNVISTSSSSSSEQHLSDPELSQLQNLGFEEDELEMFFHPNYFRHISVEELIDRYLEIAQRHPHNLNWSTRQEASEGNYAVKRNVAQDTLNSYYHPDSVVSGGRLSKKSYKKKRGTKKRTSRTRSHRKRNTRKRSHRRRQN